MSLRVKRANSIADSLIKVIGSGYFFIGVVVLSVLQSLWFALTFQPLIFDEIIHVGMTSVYLHRLSPFISHQPTSMDVLGNVVRNPSYLYYYIMSWPLKLIDLFTHNITTQVILLRLINIGMFVAGLIIYRRALSKAGAPRSLTNLTFLFLILSPIFAILGGAVNYDNAIFLLSGLILLLAVDVVKSKQVSFQRLSLILIIGLLGSLVKFVFLALFIPLALFLTYDLWQKHRTKIFKLLFQSFNKLINWRKIVLVIALIISVALFIERPVLNQVKYHTVSPTCVQVLKNEARCSQNVTASRDSDVLAAKTSTGFVPVNPYEYMLRMWIPGMITSQTIILQNQGPSPVMHFLFYSGTLCGAVLVLIYLRELAKNKAYKLFLVVMGGYLFILVATLYNGYTERGVPIAITARYFLPVAPIFILFVGISLVKLLGKYKKTLLVILLGTIILFSQGGGMITYLLAPNANAYWNNQATIKVNNYLRAKFDKLVINIHG